MANPDPIYKINNKEIPASTIKLAAEQNGMTFEEYVTRRGAVLVPGKKTDSTTADPNVESENTGSTSAEDFSVSRLGDAEVQLDEFSEPVTIKAWEEETNKYIDENPDLTADELSEWINRPGGPTESQYSFQEEKEIFEANKKEPKLDNPNYSPNDFIISLYEDPGFNKNKPALSAYDNELEFLKNKQKDYPIMSTESADIQSQINQLEYNKQNELEDNRTTASRARNLITQKINEADAYWNDAQAKLQAGEITPEEFAAVERNYDNKRANIFQNSLEKDRYDEQTLLLNEVSTAKTKDTYSSFGSSDLGENKKEQIEFDQKVEDEIINKLYSDNKLKGKTLDGNLNLEGKEMLITEAKSKVLNQSYEEYLNEYDKAQEIIFAADEASSVTPEAATAAQAILYNAADKLQTTSTKLAFNIGEQVFDNNFQMTEDFIKWRDRHIDGGFVGGTADFIGTLVQGGQKLIGESIVGSAIWLNRLAFTGMGTFEEDEYSRLDMVSDMFSNYNSFNYLGVSPKGGSLSEDGISFRSGSKTIANMLPFTIGVALAARKGDMKGLKNAYSLLKGMGASASTINKIKMGGFAFRATVNDNYMEGKQMGLDDSQALAYSSMASTATAVVQGIMPDVNFFKTNIGKSMLNTVVENLKKATTKEARKAVGKQFVNSLLGEIGEEEAELLLQDIAKITVGLSNETKFTDFDTQFETIGGTILLAGGTSTVMAPTQFSNFKNKIYNQYRTQGADIIKTLQESKKVVETKLKRARTQQSKDAAQRQLDEINSAIDYGGDIIKAINVAPDVMNDEQIDLLIQKNQLLERKAKADKRYTKGIDAEIEAIDAKIEASQVKQQSSIIEERTEAGTKKIADALGITFEKGNKAKISELIAQENAAREERNKGKSKANKEDLINVNEALAQNGFIIQNADGTQTIAVNEDVAGTNKAVTTAQHELLHGVLLKTITDNPGAIVQMGNALRSEIDKMLPNDISFNNVYIQGRLEAYKDSPSSVKAEELLTIFSEGLTQGFISFEENAFTKIGDFIRQGLQRAGMNVTFNSGRDVFNFIKDFNKSVIEGKGLGKGLTKAAKEGAKVGKKLGSTSAFLYNANFEANIQNEYNSSKLELPKKALKIAMAYRSRVQELINKSSNDVFGTAEKANAVEYALIGKNNPNSIYNTVLNYDNNSGITLDDTIGKTVSGIGETAVTEKYSKEGPKSVLNEINNLVPPSVKTQADYFSPKVFNPIYNATLPNGVISNYIKSKSPSKEVGEKAIAGIQDRLVNYDPAAERKKAGNKEPITFGEFIFANTNFIKLDAKKALFKESEAAKKTTDLDTKEAQSKIAEDDAVKKDRPKFRKLIDSSVLPGFTIKEIGGKLTKVLKVLKSKLDAKVSINKSVSPLIAEIKKAMGKQADIDLKKAMGGKADAQLQKWLLKNKKAILENMTTTWLMGAIPKAIQKSVGGTYKVDSNGTRVKDSYGDFVFVPNFTSDWQGKTIDREKTSTNKLGKTAGGDIVRRLPNIATALSDADFVGSVLQDVSIDADGKMTSGAPIRGKKESMAKAIAEEISLEIFNKELQDENSEISKAFENNQVARGVVLVDNFVEDVARQSERGTVKFSKAAIRLGVASDIIDGINTEEFKNRFFTHANDPKNKLPLYTSLIEQFQRYSIEDLKVSDLRTIAAELSKDYTFKPFGEIGIERIQETEGVLKTLKYILENTKEGLTRGNSYATAQQIYQSVDTKLDEKTIQGLNEGRAAVKKVVEVLVDQGFTGNEIKNIFVAVYSPSGLGGFKGKLNKDGKTRATPDSDILVESDLGLPNYKKDTETGMPTTQIENRGSFMVSVSDFEQNFLRGIEMGDKVSTRTDAYTKNFWSKDNSVYNKLDNEGKKEYLQELQEGKKEFQASLIKFIEAVNKADISPAAQRTLIRLPFAAMDGLGKITSAPRWMPAKLDGTLLSLKDLVKLGFGRKDGKIDKGVFEHTKPANRMAIAAYIYSMTGKKADLDILIEELSDFDTAFITEGMDKGLVRNKLQSLMGLNYVRGAGVMTTRYAEMIQEMNKAGVTFYDAKNNTFLSPAGALGPQLNQEMENNLAPVKTEQKAINNARSIKWSQSPKKIRVFDFDDTLARTKSNVLYTMPDGTTGKIDAATFAKDAGKMEAEGAQWDFSEFSKVMNGQAGPLLEVAKIIADKRGTKDVFVLTARPADAAGPIQEFLSELGLDIPLENITGLGNGTPKAKADWIIDKVADGYNDFYFADDHTGNVKAVKDALDTFDVKGKVQLAKVKFSQSLDTKFNDMIERQKGVESFKEFSKATAQRRGKKTGKFKFFISPSAEDFRGLTQYKFAGKGKQGEADQKFFEESLMDPYFQGVAALESARQTIKEDTKALLKTFKPVRKKLNKLIKGEQYTYDAAVRVYLWNKAGEEVPGLSKRDNKKLNDLVANDPELSSFADGLLIVSKKDAWPAPSEYWMAQTTLSDLNNLTEKTNRKEYLAEFIENVDIIFSEKNLNKVEALYGEASRKAIENSIYAMKSGSNSPNQSGDAITSKWMNWVNSSIGTIMFFNRRSAVLQTLSAANFINWSDNNPAKAAIAFANQPQYWKDFVTIFNSDKLKQRRGGLKSDVQEAEIANAAKNSQDKAQAVISYILKIGFTPTQIADSFAISMGGATLYRNRINTYKKQGLSLKEAETKAFEDFSKLSDEAQQSGDPALVSQQQRSVAGRLILSFQNTTMQYTRLMKKSGQDLINGRGDAKTHISKILYYGAIQNFLFNALSKTAFALIPGFEEEDEEDEDKKNQAIEKKAAGILDGMADSVIRGTGIYGAIFTTLKNSISTWKREDEKGFTGDQTKTIIELANLAPAIGSKLRKVYSSIQTRQFDRDIIEKHPWDVTINGKFNPSSTYTIIANLSSAAFNVPLDRALAEARSVGEMLDDRNSKFQRIALALGWRTWNVGAKNEEFDLIKLEGKAKRKIEGKEKAKKTRAAKKEKEKQRVANLSPTEKLKERREKEAARKKKLLAKRRAKLTSRLTKNKK